MKPINKPLEQLEKAASFIHAMKISKTLTEYEASWIDFLHNLERAWNKLSSHLSRSPKYQGWSERGRVMQLRKKDPLLSYLVNARGADEHSIHDITQLKQGGIGINPASGNSLHINKLSINNNRISIDSDQPIKIDFIPGEVKLLPVVNRGRTYQVPSVHLDNSIMHVNPVNIAELGISFYRDYFTKAEKYFVK
jgi:hypothetical protein